MAVYTIKSVEGPRSWEWNGQTNYDFKLTLDGVEKPAILTQRNETPPAGQVDLELTDHPRFPDVMKAKRVRAFNGGGGPRPEDPKRTAHIAFMNAQGHAAAVLNAKAAAGLATADDFKPANIDRLVAYFVERASKARDAA